MDTRRICFVHIPKCGGSSFRTAISKYGPFGLIKRKGVHAMSAKKSYQEAVHEGIDPLIYRENVLIDLLSKSQYKVVFGHFRCTSKTRERFQDRWKFVTLLRNPVDRWISHYHYDRYKSSTHHKTELDIHQYIKSEEGKRVGTLYLRHFSSYTEDIGISKVDYVIEAVQNIKAFDSCLILEEIQDTMPDLESLLGIKFKMRRRNQNSAKVSTIKKK